MKTRKQLWDAIDRELEKKVPFSCVSRFYSDEENLCIAYHRGQRDDVNDIMRAFGWELYDVGCVCVDDIMATFKKVKQ